MFYSILTVNFRMSNLDVIERLYQLQNIEEEIKEEIERLIESSDEDAGIEYCAARITLIMIDDELEQIKQDHPHFFTSIW